MHSASGTGPSPPPPPPPSFWSRRQELDTPPSRKISPGRVPVGAGKPPKISVVPHLDVGHPPRLARHHPRRPPRRRLDGVGVGLLAPLEESRHPPQGGRDAGLLFVLHPSSAALPPLPLPGLGGAAAFRGLGLGDVGGGGRGGGGPARPAQARGRGREGVDGAEGAEAEAASASASASAKRADQEGGSEALASRPPAAASGPVPAGGRRSRCPPGGRGGRHGFQIQDHRTKNGALGCGLRESAAGESPYLSRLSGGDARFGNAECGDVCTYIYMMGLGLFSCGCLWRAGAGRGGAAAVAKTSTLCVMREEIPTRSTRVCILNYE